MGVDHLGGDRNPTLIEELVDAGLITEERIDQSARRLLREKFRLGLFEHRRADVEGAQDECGSPVFVDKGLAAQRASLVLLSDAAGMVPDGARIHVENIEDADGFAVTEEIAEAEAIVVRLEATFEPGRGSVVAEYFHGGTLDCSDDTIARLRDYAARAPLYLAVFLERPAILGPLVDLGNGDRRIRRERPSRPRRIRRTRAADRDAALRHPLVDGGGRSIPRRCSLRHDAPLFRSGFGIVRDAVSLERA